MSPAPLPQASNPIRTEAFVDLLGTVLDEKTAAYVSAPITSGRRFLKWFKERGSKLDPNGHDYRNELFHAVTKPNCDEINRRVVGLRLLPDWNSLINPAAFSRPEWEQDDYQYFWGRVIETFAKTVIFLRDWQYSSGCGYEFLCCIQTGVQALKEDRSKLSEDEGYRLVEAALTEIRESGASTRFLERILQELKANRLRGEHIRRPRRTPPIIEPATEIVERRHFKDAVLDQLATVANIAQFISFGPDPTLPQRFSRIKGFRPNHHFTTPKEAIRVLLAASPEGTVNIRSFCPDRPTAEPLVKKLSDVASVFDCLQGKVARGFYTIVNETIDPNDGGVSGVALGDFLEFAPLGTPQDVEKPGICFLPRDVGLRILQRTYGVRATLSGYSHNARVEFSFHPRRRGLCDEHTVVWEIEKMQAAPISSSIQWPHKFSRFLGDKAFGLLLADALELPVPRSVVVCRNVAPFVFGQGTGTGETWMRTCPEVRAPGQYRTTYGWSDPFEILAQHDLNRSVTDVRIVSVLAQEGVHPEFSGSLAPRPFLAPVVEGVKGRGDAFMTGRAEPCALPRDVRRAVLELYAAAESRLGPVEFEWVFDGKRAWVVQIHAAADVLSTGDAIYPGDAHEFERFDVELGLEALRALIPKLVSRRSGLVLVGNVGITSHFGDLLRNAKIPSRIERHTTANAR